MREGGQAGPLMGLLGIGLPSRPFRASLDAPGARRYNARRMETYTREDLLRGLRGAGLERGDLVFFQSRLHGLGRPEGVKSPEDLCRLFLEALLEALGPEGTLVVPAFSTQVARRNEPYVVEQTRPNYGLFPEYVFNRPEFLRSLHPMWSVAACGPLREQVCRSGGASNFGAFSPFDMLVKLGARNVFCGLPVRTAATVSHYLEMHYGVPYVYNKLLRWRPVELGAAAGEPQLAAVRYAGAVPAQDLSRFEQDLLARGAVRSARVGGGEIHSASMADMIEVGYAGLRRDVYYFLPAPPEFDYGLAPYDGPTLAREQAAGADQAPDLEALLERARPQAPRLAGLLRHLAAESGPEARAELARSLAGLPAPLAAEGELLAAALPAGAFAAGPGAEALAQLLRPERRRLLRFARNEFLAPHCLASPLHADLWPGHGLSALLALEFGAARMACCAPASEAAGHLKALLAGRGQWELRPAAPDAALPLADGSAATLAAEVRAAGAAGRLLAEVARALRPGGAALAAGPAGELRAAAAAAGLAVERELAAEPGALVLRKAGA